jgi:hypothetical protein
MIRLLMPFRVFTDFLQVYAEKTAIAPFATVFLPGSVRANDLSGCSDNQYHNMPCNHKFLTHLNLEHLDFEPETLVVGTFTPEWPAGDQGDWFYGRTHDADGNRNNLFWDVLPRLYGEPGLIDASASDWKLFCRNNKIALTSIISSIDDADPSDAGHARILAGAADKAIAYHFDDFTFVDIVKILQDHPTIKNVYLTRGITEAFWRHIWNPVVRYCHQHNLHERRLLTPSGSDIYQHSAHNSDHPENQIPLLEDYILWNWKQSWHF